MEWKEIRRIPQNIADTIQAYTFVGTKEPFQGDQAEVGVNTLTGEVEYVHLPEGSNWTRKQQQAGVRLTRTLDTNRYLHVREEDLSTEFQALLDAGFQCPEWNRKAESHP